MQGFKVVVFVIFYFLSFLGTGTAQEKILTLAQAIESALQKNPTLKAADHLAQAADATVGSARSGLFPRIDVYEGFTRTTNPMMAFGSKLNQEVIASSDFAPPKLNNPSPINNFNSQFVVAQPIFDQGKTWIGIRQAKTGRQAVQEERERVKQEVIFEVIKSYSQALRACEDLTLARKTETTAAAHVKLAEDLFQTGQVVKSDLLSAQVRLSEVKEMVIQARNGVAIALATLNKVMGMDQNNTFEIQGDLGCRPDPTDLNTAIAEALEKRPDLLAMNNYVKNGREEVRMAKTNYLPKFYLMGQYDFNDRNAAWGREGENWTVAGIFQFNFFDGLRSTYKIKEAHALVQQLTSHQDDLKSAIELEVRESFHRRKEAGERVKVVREALAQAEESLRIVEDRYKAGLSRMVELLDNEVALTRARRNHLNAQCDLKVTCAQLDLARGVIMESQYGGTEKSIPTVEEPAGDTETTLQSKEN
jgi:outer membrane protein TolC